MLDEAVDFIKMYYMENNLPVDQLEERLKEVEKDIRKNGQYTHTSDELAFGARVAWRNSNRCIGRLFWQTLQVKDQRSILDEETIYEKLLEHIEFATNEGKIRPTISIFEPQKVRIWNHQLIRYAGYEQEDGTVIGDSDSLAFTKECIKLGWHGNGGQFDVLPLVIQVENRKPCFFDIPKEYIKEVSLRHPEFDWFTDLHLKWYAVPIISSMKLEVGGITYGAAPFNGWYMGTEIGARNLADDYRYNMLPIIGESMGLDTSSNANLWRDRALVELNIAVLYSFKEDGVSIVDHHTAAQQFKRFEANEASANRDVTGNWTWLIPPLSPATTHIFHRPYDNTKNLPGYSHQKRPY
ncbi:nitric oxide synthase oxygenase [Rummeliibacillus suwonensis]|uniref:nitric oxide synthase oxygenase n=1 Tax=Rummeliibacillus suwonensis TaxID=1306154 RepID=UPI0011B5D47C|nr:nitric oxide synthase oxygenase [Rummeliibacillus suwonensis]MBO2537300.1 nitric oxide synthase oxygenase [Rummeliibacillus suwonensis]